MKLTIKQHTDNLRNAKASQVEFAERQLNTATMQGRDGYDPERFLRTQG